MSNGPRVSLEGRATCVAMGISMEQPLARRRFLGRAAALCLGAIVPAMGRPRWPRRVAAAVTLRIALLNTGPTARSRHQGVLLGVEEARHAAELFGGSVALEVIDHADAAATSAAATSAAAIIGDDDEGHCRSILAAHRPHAPLLMNVACASDVLRGAACSRRAFHVAPSDAMLRDARTSARGATDVVVWNSSLTRFGADTLNQRFRRRFGDPMTPTAWTAWFAVKVLWESALRMKSADPDKIADYLTRDTTRFDGHKGQPLSFRISDHQLRQPVYAHTAAGWVEAPPTSSAAGESASPTACRMPS